MLGKEGRKGEEGRKVEEGRERCFNVRKLRELPHCLSSCGRTEELSALLVDFRWIQACVLTTSCGDIVKDFAHIIPVVPLGR